jgi:tRNA threonylcarbamoyladenosine biosynthesis protein TsaE
MEVNYTIDEIARAADEFVRLAKNYTVFAFTGPMAAGKTTLIHAICKELKVTGVLSSPTYSIINQYYMADGRLIYHIDLYRLKDDEEALQAGVEECLLSGEYCFVEWPGRAPGIFPENTLFTNLEVTDTNTRKLEIKL